MSTDNAHLRRNLDLVRRGIKSRAPGIHKCRDCTEPFITTGTARDVWCAACRVNHTRQCTTCKTPYPIDADTSGLCPLHREHPTLFGGAA